MRQQTFHFQHTCDGFVSVSLESSQVVSWKSVVGAWRRLVAGNPQGIRKLFDGFNIFKCISHFMNKFLFLNVRNVLLGLFKLVPRGFRAPFGRGEGGGFGRRQKPSSTYVFNSVLRGGVSGSA